MFNIDIADLIVTIDNKYSYIETKCKDYLTKKDNNTNIVLSVSEKDIQNSIDYKLKYDGESISIPEAEFDAIHYYLYSKLHKFDAFWLHSVLIEKEGVGYAFTAAPGVGKSTHAELWLKTFNDAVIVNGDNPIIRQDKNDGIYYGYGTPFCGKEGFNKKTRVPIKAICFLERSDKNYVEKMNTMDAILLMVKENFTLRKDAIGPVMRLLINMTDQVKFFRVYCNMDEDAATISYEGISKYLRNK